MAVMTDETPRTFSYQDTLRAIGAWLDVRGYRDVKIIESDGELVIEAQPGTASSGTSTETLRFDPVAVHRLRCAALSDRNAPHDPRSFLKVARLTPLVASNEVH